MRKRERRAALRVVQKCRRPQRLRPRPGGWIRSVLLELGAQSKRFFLVFFMSIPTEPELTKKKNK